MLQLCRTCHGEGTSGYIAINDNNVNSTRVKSQLLSCFPELQQDLVKNPVMCSACVDALSLVCSFKTQCLQTEKRIRNYFRNTKLSEKSVTFIELYKEDTKVKSSALCNSLDVNDLVLKTSNIVADSNSDADADTECVIGLATNRGNVNNEDVENGVIVKDECDLTQFKVEENLEDDYLTSNNELEKLSLLQFLDESLQITQNRFKNLEECSVKFVELEDLPQSQPGKVLKTTLSSTRSENHWLTIEAAELANGGKEEKYLKKKNLVSNVITDTHSNCKNVTNEMEARNIQSKELLTKECFVKLVRTDDILRLQSQIALKTIVSPSRPESQCGRSDTHSSINLKGQEGLLTATATSSVIIDTGETPYGCTVCEFRTSLRKSLIQHMRTHKEEKPFRCSICDFCGADRCELKIHMKTHTGEKPFRCSICEFRTMRESNLKRHIRIHTGEKPFRCSICEFCTAYQDSLKKHMKTHTEEKPFSCSICEFCTTRRDHLKSHMRTHTGEKPFRCSICEFCTAYRDSLKKHMRTHSGKKPFRCSICEFSTAWQEILKTHMITHILPM